MVSVYAFSIENFKRNSEEVDSLMELAETKFHEFSKKRCVFQYFIIRYHNIHFLSSMVAQLGVQIRVSGALHLLPRSVQEAAYTAMESTKHHDKATLNICCPYTSRDEISQTMSDILEAHSLGLIEQDDMDQELLDRSLFIGDLPPLEVLVRTSGEIRLSDYMLWQASEDCVVHFVDILWPEFGFADMLKIIVSYQMHCLTQRLFMWSASSHSESPAARSRDSERRIAAYLVWLRNKRTEQGFQE